MTEELIDKYGKLLAKNGIVVKEGKSDDFTSAILGNDLTDISQIETKLEQLTSKLLSLRESIDRGFDLDEFVKTVGARINIIEETINNDNYFRNNLGASEFLTKLANLKTAFKGASDYLQYQKIVADREETYKDIYKSYINLKFGKPKDDVVERNKHSIRLSYYKAYANLAREDINKAKDECEKQKQLLAGTIGNLRNGLLRSIGDLELSLSKLSLEPSNMEQLANTIKWTRDFVVNQALGNREKEAEFNELCARFSLEYDGTKAIDLEADKEFDLEPTTIEPTPVEPTPVEPTPVEPTPVEPTPVEPTPVEPTPVEPTPVEPTPVEPTPVEPTSVEPTSVEPTESKIKNAQELIDSVISLNPDIKIDKNKKEQNGEMVEYLETNEDLSKIKLPEGFKYTEGLGINNKVSDTEPYIAVELEQTKKKTDEHEESRVPSGKIGVKRSRKAIIAPFVKATLVCGGIAFLGSAALGIAAASIIPVTLYGAGFGIVAQALYTKIIKGTNRKIPQFEGNPEDVLFASAGSKILINNIKEGVPKLMDVLKEKWKSRKTKKETEIPETEKTETIDQQTDTPVEELKPSEPIDKKSESLDDAEGKAKETTSQTDSQTQEYTLEDILKEFSEPDGSKEKPTSEFKLEDILREYHEEEEMSMGGRR